MAVGKSPVILWIDNLKKCFVTHIKLMMQNMVVLVKNVCCRFSKCQIQWLQCNNQFKLEIILRLPKNISGRE